jgi:hypothetical protein
MFGREVFEDNLILPFPWLWWEEKARFGTRTACRYGLGMAESLSVALRESYIGELSSGLLKRVDPCEELTDGTPLIPWYSLWGPIPETHDAFLSEMVPDLFDLLAKELAISARMLPLSDWDERAADIRHLLCWNLLYEWFYQVSGLYSFHLGDSRSWFRVGIEEKSSFASASANATYWEWRDKNEQYMLSITTPMTALMLQGLHKEMDETFQASGKEPVEFGNPPWAHKL